MCSSLYGRQTILEASLPWISLLKLPGEVELVSCATLRESLTKSESLFVAFGTGPWTAMRRSGFADPPPMKAEPAVVIGDSPQERLGYHSGSEEKVGTLLDLWPRCADTPLIGTILRVAAEAWQVSLEDLSGQGGWRHLWIDIVGPLDPYRMPVLGRRCPKSRRQPMVAMAAAADADRSAHFVHQVVGFLGRVEMRLISRSDSGPTSASVTSSEGRVEVPPCRTEAPAQCRPSQSGASTLRSSRSTTGEAHGEHAGRHRVGHRKEVGRPERMCFGYVQGRLASPWRNAHCKRGQWRCSKR